MKLIVCGGRYYNAYPLIEYVLNGLHATYGITEIVHGNATGADECGKDWALKYGIPEKAFKANWYPDKKNLDRGAGPKRNQLMAEYADGCVAFPGGDGTRDMVNRAIKRQMQFWDFRQLTRQKPAILETLEEVNAAQIRALKNKEFD